MERVDLGSASRSRCLAGKMGVARGFHGQNFCPACQRKSEGAQPRKEIRDSFGILQPLTHRSAQLRLAVMGRLKERPRWKWHRNSAQFHRRWLWFPASLRPEPFVDGQPSEFIRTGEFKQVFGIFEPVERNPFKPAIHALIDQGQFNFGGIFALLPAQQFAQVQGGLQQFRVQHRAFGKIHYSMGAALAKADQRTSATIDRMHGGAPAAMRGRKMRRSDIARGQTLPQRGMDRPIRNEPSKSSFVKMLKIASSATPKMAAGRRGVMRARLDRSIAADTVTRRRERHVAATGGNAVTFCGNADNFFQFVHKQDS